MIGSNSLICTIIEGKAAPAEGVEHRFQQGCAGEGFPAAAQGVALLADEAANEGIGGGTLRRGCEVALPG
ncbi:MAG: hypothetical protein RBU21_23715 [FCB group bacterium]|nr:hypothetical protein [FCB group bacterium]